MDTVLLRTFLEVSKTRHFGRAAEHLFITHSAVSFRIKQLEETVGTRLFNRQRNNLSLTAAGERLIPYAENLLASWQMALQDVGMPGKQAVQLTLGGTANIWDVVLQQMLPDIANRTPAVSYRTEVNTQVNLVRALLDRSLDLGLVFDPPKIAEVNVEPLLQLPLQLACNKKSVNFSQLEDAGYVYVDWGSTFNLQHAQFMQQSVAPVLHTSQGSIAREYVRKTGTMAFLPVRWINGSSANAQTLKDDDSKANDPKGKRRKSPLYAVAEGPEIVRHIYAIYRTDNEKYDQIVDVINLVRAFSGEESLV